MRVPIGKEVGHCPECDKAMVVEDKGNPPLCDKCRTNSRGWPPHCTSCVIYKEDGKMVTRVSMVNPECDGCFGAGFVVKPPLNKEVWCWDCEAPCVACAMKFMGIGPNKAREEDSVSDSSRLLRYAETILRTGQATDNDNTKERLRAKWLSLPEWVQITVLSK